MKITSGMFGLNAEVIQKLQSVFRQHKSVTKVVIFGSRAMDTAKTGSDIDLSILSSEISWTELLKIETEIDELLLPYKVDLLIFESLENESLKNHIEHVGKLFYFS